MISDERCKLFMIFELSVFKLIYNWLIETTPNLH